MYGRVFNYRLHKFFPRELIKFERTLILAAFEAASQAKQLHAIPKNKAIDSAARTFWSADSVSELLVNYSGISLKKAHAANANNTLAHHRAGSLAANGSLIVISANNTGCHSKEDRRLFLPVHTQTHLTRSPTPTRIRYIYI